MAEQKRPTLYDVARLAGVSHMTVSRVVRGGMRVSSGTKERVEEAIRALGYRPDPALSALAAYRERRGRRHGSVLGYLLCDTDEYGLAVLAGARAEAERLGYSIEAQNLPRQAAGRRRLARIWFHRGVQGVLLGTSQAPQDLEGWDWSSFAPVSLGALAHHPAMNSVAMDYFDGVMKAANWLAEREARRIGFAVDSALESRTGHRWLGAYTSSLAGRAGIPPYAGSLGDQAALRRWVRRHQIDGVLTIHLAVWKALRDSMLRFAFLNAYECPPGVPHIASSPSDIGGEGVRLVHHQLLAGELGLPAESKTLSLQGKLVV
ncbi:MAG: LacI family DNA-binding transcriptional regulator [Verrucomicrobia bacterium]|nr:LacI family DNA-binding transcriptional regulator [Verrucomicrobiota bacterium]